MGDWEPETLGKGQRTEEGCLQYLGAVQQHSHQLALWAGNSEMERPPDPVAPLPLDTTQLHSVPTMSYQCKAAFSISPQTCGCW